MAHNAPVATLSFDDGGWQDFKVMEILDKMSVRATFYLTTSLVVESVYDGLTIDEIVQGYRGHEVGSHGIHHRRMTGIDERTAHEEIVNSRKILQNLFQQDVKCFAYPYGDHDALTVAAVCAAEYQMGRTCKRNDPSKVMAGRPQECAPITCIIRRDDSWREPLQIALKELRDIHIVSHAWELMKYGIGACVLDAILLLKTHGYDIQTNEEFSR